VSTPNATTEKVSIVIRDAIGMSESQMDGIGISLPDGFVFISWAVRFLINRFWLKDGSYFIKLGA
jgi:hypothetical protein